MSMITTLALALESGLAGVLMSGVHIWWWSVLGEASSMRTSTAGRMVVTMLESGLPMINLLETSWSSLTLILLEALDSSS